MLSRQLGRVKLVPVKLLGWAGLHGHGQGQRNTNRFRWTRTLLGGVNRDSGVGATVLVKKCRGGDGNGAQGGDLQREAGGQPENSPKEEELQSGKVESLATIPVGMADEARLNQLVVNWVHVLVVMLVGGGLPATRVVKIG